MKLFEMSQLSRDGALVSILSMLAINHREEEK